MADPTAELHNLRLPAALRQEEPANFELPDLDWMCCTWHVTHSTLPMWRTKRNVRITYMRLPDGRLDDLVTYQNPGSDAVKTVHGVDTPKEDSWQWRGYGWLMIASSKWELLGWGTGGGVASNGSDSKEPWVVTYFAASLFTPAGIDIYSRNENGLSQVTLDMILGSLKTLASDSSQEFADLVDEIFEVERDGSTK